MSLHFFLLRKQVVALFCVRFLLQLLVQPFVCAVVPDIVRVFSSLLSSFEVRSELRHKTVEFVEVDVRQYGGAYTSYKVANLPIEFSTSIPRTQLRPGYGDGFLGAPLQRVPPHASPSPRAQGGQRGTSRTQPQSNPGSAHHV